ncbi:hypothetical protein BESB_028150 [Besnoitia besnoiti]|uniref:Uncharacterized protein n=1 Tax=Besnoitia besnoiti TaxID=94643 RepID=A0A2A9M7K9_BESBE|nr:uncharacterized protein BESB_028150 [Besnoitia besnoiti]PFH31380.1 hypothetical protein BESB_028150 [Besnoitia besnoiti]
MATTDAASSSASASPRVAAAVSANGVDGEPRHAFASSAPHAASRSAASSAPADAGTRAPLRLLVWFLYHNEYNAFRFQELEALAQEEGVSRAELWGLDVPADDASGGQALCCCPASSSPPAPAPDAAPVSSSPPPAGSAAAALSPSACSALHCKASHGQFAYCFLPSEAAAGRILKKSILIRAFIEVWADEETYPAVLSRMLEPANAARFQSFINDEKTWAFRVKAFGRSLSVDEQREKMDFFACLFKGTEKVSLENPDVTLAVAEEWVHASCPGDTPSQTPLRIYLGREIASRHAEKNAQPWWWSLRLPRRPVLGPTSLDVELAFLMCHQAQVKRGSLVLDPFVGTGSILISASYYGALCVGSDIDIRVLKGYSVAYLNPHIKHPPGASKNVFRNFDEYGLRRPEILRCDNAAWVWRLPPASGDASAESGDGAANGSTGAASPSTLLTREGDPEVERADTKIRAYLEKTACHGGKPWADAIVTDPPYGIRAGARQSGHQQKHKRGHERTNEERLTYISPTVLYDPQTVISDLLNLAARLLVDGGRLVFLLPIELRNAEEELELLRHEDLDLISCSLQPLSGGLGRYLVTMRRRPRTAGRSS